ncbi:MAG: Mu-like prophage major head subunit gpT family protein [Gemmobacter sp.]
MITNDTNIELTFRGFQKLVSDAVLAAPAHAKKIAMTVPSSGRSEDYGWLSGMPSLREWIGPRVVTNLVASGFTITNRRFESTVAVKRTDFADDRLGVFAPFFSEMGQAQVRHQEELVFGLLKAGFDSLCYDGQNFFDTEHPVREAGATEPTFVANTDGGSGPGWYLLDTSRAMRPLIWQEREPYEFTQVNKSGDLNVFLNDEYLYGLRARVNAGFGLWQLAWGSKQALNEGNYAAARAAMMSFKGEGGKLLGVTPTVMVVPPALENDALHLLNTEIKSGGGSNPWKGTCELIVSPYLA